MTHQRKRNVTSSGKCKHIVSLNVTLTVLLQEKVRLTYVHCKTPAFISCRLKKILSKIENKINELYVINGMIGIFVYVCISIPGMNIKINA